MAVHYSCAPDDGRKSHPKHVELKTFQEYIIFYIQLDLSKTQICMLTYLLVNIFFLAEVLALDRYLYAYFI
jgi:hypothetical protein